MPPFDEVPDLTFFFMALVGIVLVLEGGYRLGWRRRAKSDQERETPVGEMVAAQLGLLAFMLAFTFGIAASRYENRRQVLLEEANGIGTAYLRTGLIPEPHRTEARRLLREYVDVRVAAVQDDTIRVGIVESEALQKKLWTQTVEAANSNTNSVQVGLFVDSVNNVIDLHSKRLRAALQSRIPVAIWSVLFAVTALAFAAMGYHSGLTRTVRSPTILSVALSFAAVIWLVANLDRPAKGTLEVSQKPLIELRHQMTGDE